MNTRAMQRDPFSGLLLAAVLFLGVFNICPVQAQFNTGTILGTVQDQTGAVIPGATVAVTNIGTGQERSVKSNSEGVFTIPNLQVGHYSILAEHGSFASTKIADVELQVAQQASVTVVLKPASATQQITVIATEVPMLNKTTAAVGQVIDTQTVQDMPLNGRNFWQLTQLTPGVNYVQGGQNIQPGGTSIRASAVNVDVNGLSPSWTGWYLDGSNVTEFQLGGTLIQPNVDALDEFKVESSSMGAEYGHSPTIINATLRSGTNKFHGSAWDFLRNNALDAKGYFFRPGPGSKERDEPLHRNQFGFTVGGPILKNKTFFFMDAQTTLLSQAQDFVLPVPSDAERAGIFPSTIKNPATGQQVSYNGVPNEIPPSLISQPATYFLQFMPHQNSGSNALVNNQLKQQLEVGDIRIDQALASKDQLMARYSIANNKERDPNQFPAMGFFPLRSRGQNIVVRETHTFNARFINEAQASYYRSYFLFTSSEQGQDMSGQAGIIGLAGLAPTQYLGAPSMTISGYSNYTDAATNQYPKSNRIRDWQYVDHMTYVKGNNDMRFGYELFHSYITFVAGQSSLGIYNFNGKYSGDNFADFLMGYPKSATRSYFRQLWGNSANNHVFYFQDNFHAQHGLSINAGLRWEINPFYNAVKGQTTGFDTATGDLIVPSDFSINAQPLTPTLNALFNDRFEYTDALGLPENVRKTDYHDVSPRLGLAWSPGKGNTVIRGGYGMFFMFVDDNYINNTQNTVPFIAAQTVNNTSPATYTFANFFGTQPLAAPNPNPGQPCSWGVVANSCSQPAISSADVHPRDSYIQEWNLAVQHQFGSHISLNTAYVGSKSSHIVVPETINDPPAGAGTVQSRRPWQQWSTVTLYHFGGYGFYDSLQAKLEGRDYHGATFLASYTYGKSLTLGTYGSGSISTTSTIKYYGVPNFDLKHNFVASVLYDLPFGNGKTLLNGLPKVANGFVDHWNLSNIITLQSGLPYTATISSDTANTGVGSQRPNQTGPVKSVGKVSCWIQIAANPNCPSSGTPAFSVPAAYTYGDVGINTLRADPLKQVDITAMKNIDLGESRSLEFRVSFYNLFNHPTFAGPTTTIDTASGGAITATLNPSRLGEVAMKVHF
jgi:Carboxypeptidase regulatory-like domain